MCNQKNIQSIIDNLKTIALTPKPCLAREVAIEALDHDTPEEIASFFENLLQYGCVSGMVTSLIYYSDTEAFFDEHYHEIMELKEEYEDMLGQPMQIPYHLKNHLAWFAFEETARRLWEA
jgi:phosphoribosyl 1,2-cyclic phosphodiesterase